MAVMLEKTYNDYCKKYFRENDVFSWAAVVNSSKHLMKQLSEMRVVTVKGHPPFEKVMSHEIVKCGKI